MGLFDKLLKKKKKAPARPPKDQWVATTPMVAREAATPVQPLPVKRPPEQVRRVEPKKLKQRPIQSRKIAAVDHTGLADDRVQREISKSVARIPKSVHEPVKKPVAPAAIKKPVKAKQAVRPPHGMVRKPKQVRIARDRLPAGSGTGPGTAAKTGASSATAAGAKSAATAPPASKKPAAEPNAKIFEDTLGEEELFKKLAQWDKDLKRRPVHKKIGVKTPSGITGTARSSSTGTAAGAAVSEKPTTADAGVAAPTPKMDTEELTKREDKLRKIESKLLEREKKLTEKEEMDKVFNDLEISELEGFQEEEVIPGLEEPEDLKAKEERLEQWESEIKRREMELKKASEFTAELEAAQELLQPLKNLIFTNFIVGPSNRFAHDVALAVAKAPADAYNPLFIYSEVGLGKTHLLCAIGNYIKSKNEKVRIVYASSEKFTNELLDYLRLGEMEKFRTKYRNVDVLLIDDIQFIGGQEGTQEEFFHTFNALYNNHKQIVITSDRPPKNIAHLKDRLRSRFEGGLIVNIKPPDLGTRTRILHEKAERDGIYIPEEIVNYIASKVKSNVRTLIGILNRVVAHSSLTDRDLDTSLVDEVLNDVLDEKAELSVE
jgi:chromosomal replication initiator protein DnaA